MNDDRCEQQPSTTTNEFPTIRIMVVGQNRPRLVNIMSLVKGLEEAIQEQADDNLSLFHEYIPCLATMDCYENTDGTMIRYMSNFISLGGSSMMKYFDDDEFRESLQLVLLVGYEWNNEREEELSHIRSYLQANQFDNVSIECVAPTVNFETFQEEMNFFKNLTEDDKIKQETRQELGPWKMARFVVDNVQALKRRQQQQQNENEPRNTIQNQHGQQDHTGVTTNNDGMKVSTTTSTNDTDLLVNDEPIPKPTLMIDTSLPIFACRICRTPLLDQSHLAEGHVQNLHSFRRSVAAGTNSKNVQQRRPCQSLFCDESVLQWLSLSSSASSSSSSLVLEGRLSCFKCSNKLGHWKWTGSQCSCGTWVVPAIQIPLSKVDIILPRTRNNNDGDNT